MPPKVQLIVPTLIELFASCSFVIPAEVAKLLEVIPVADIFPPDIDIPEPAPAVKALCFALNVV